MYPHPAAVDTITFPLSQHQSYCKLLTKFRLFTRSIEPQHICSCRLKHVSVLLEPLFSERLVSMGPWNWRYLFKMLAWERHFINLRRRRRSTSLKRGGDGLQKPKITASSSKNSMKDAGTKWSREKRFGWVCSSRSAANGAPLSPWRQTRIQDSPKRLSWNKTGRASRVKVFQGVRYLGALLHEVSSAAPRNPHSMLSRSQLYLVASLAAQVPHMVVDYSRKRTSRLTCRGVVGLAVYSALLQA